MPSDPPPSTSCANTLVHCMLSLRYSFIDKVGIRIFVVVYKQWEFWTNDSDERHPYSYVIILFMLGYFTPRYWVPVPGAPIVWWVCTDPCMPRRRLAPRPSPCLGWCWTRPVYLLPDLPRCWTLLLALQLPSNRNQVLDVIAWRTNHARFLFRP